MNECAMTDDPTIISLTTNTFTINELLFIKSHYDESDRDLVTLNGIARRPWISI